MRTDVPPLTAYRLTPAPLSSAPDGSVRTLTLGLPDRIDFSEMLDDVGMVSGQLRLVEHRYELVRLEVTADSIGPDQLRNVPVRRLMVAAARRHAQPVTVDDSGRMTTKDLADELTADEKVVTLWHIARACRTNPNPLIRAELGLTSDQAAARRVARLRKDGVLPAAEKQGQRY